MSEPEGDTVNKSFDYRKGWLEPSSAFPEGRAAHRPMLPVTLRTIYDGWLSCYAVVDSGADYCSFPQSFIEPLGIERHALECETIMTANGEAPAYFGVVLIDLASIENYEPYNVRVCFHPSPACVLGHHGFFNRFFVVFDTTNGRFAITNRATNDPTEGANS